MITLFHDYISPASAVAVLRVHTLVAEGVPVDVVGFQPLPLEVAIPPTLAVMEELERHADDAAALGLTLGRPRRLPPTTGAHLVERLAGDRDAAVRFRAAAYRALWEDGADLAAPDVLVALATQAGLDGDLTRTRVQDRVEMARIKQQLAGARSVHVGGVPALDVDGTLVSAFLPLEDLRQLAAL